MKRLRTKRLSIWVTPELFHQIQRVCWDEMDAGRNRSIAHAARVLIGHGIHRYSEKVRQKKVK